jgi:ribonucleotide monophosphatase NagD (HAD superfamily)
MSVSSTSPPAADAAANAAANAAPTVVVRGLRDVLSSADYCGIFLDQFGVLHDGRNAYPRAAEAIGKAAAWSVGESSGGGGSAGGGGGGSTRNGNSSGLAIVIVSNSSRRAAGALGRLESLGFDRAWFAGAVTSGEVTHKALSADPCADEDETWATTTAGGGGPAPSRRTRCLHLTWAARGGSAANGGGVALPEGYTPVAPEDAPLEAELIVAHGTEGVGLPGGGVAAMPVPQLEALLDGLAERNAPPPMVVANPDFVTVDGPGRLAVMPGTLARRYAAKGGTVVLMGKPSGRIYRAARALAAAAEAGEGSEGSADPSRRRRRRRRRWLAIGDSLEHDVAGAAAAGDDVDALFVAAGIHADELGFEPPQDLALGNEGVGGEWGEAMAAAAAAAAGGGGGGPPASLAALCSKLGVAPPTYATGYLQW